MRTHGAWLAASLAAACGAPSPQSAQQQQQAEARDAVAVAQQGWHESESAAGTWRVRWRPEPDPLTFGESGRMLVEAARADGLPPDELRADAGMPEHGHGMNRVPAVARRDDGGFEVSGMLFHMGGSWELYLDVTRGAITERTQTRVELE